MLGIEVDKKGRIYVPEASTGNMGPAPLTGDIVRVGPDGHRKVTASKLSFPTGTTFGPDGALYVSNVGFGPSPNGLGEVLKITNP